MPKFMLIMRTADATPPEDLDFETVIDAMGAFNESMVEAGVLAGGDGLSDPSQGAVVTFSADADPVVAPGAYGDDRARFNGYWVLQVASQEDALQWAMRAPLGPGAQLEVRRVTDETDFADHADNEYLRKEREWRADGR